MLSRLKIFKVSLAASALLSLAPQSVALANDAYSDCSCVSAPINDLANAGQVVSLRGEVLINNVIASTGQTFASPSEIMVGTGSIEYSVGSHCVAEAASNTIVSISQPHGPGSNLCVKTANIYANSSNSASLLLKGGAIGDGRAIMLGIVGTMAGAMVIATATNNETRSPASP